MADNSVEEGCGPGMGSITDRSTVGGEADKLLTQFSDGFSHGRVFVHILGLAHLRNMPRGSRYLSVLSLL